MSNSAYKPRKLFTLEEANSTLPLVTRIIGDIVRLWEEIVKLRDEMERLTEDGSRVKAEAVLDRYHELTGQAEELADELADLGCMCKDPRLGLVDYPARVDDRIVLLCWKQGEDQIQFWHELEAGYAGRKPVKGVFA